MDFRLTEEQIQIRQTVKDFADSEIKPHLTEWDEAQKFPAVVVKKLGELGMLGAIFPEQYGGAGLSYVDYVNIIEELGAADSGIGLTVAAHNSLCTGHIYLAGSEEQKKKWLPKLTSGEVLGAWGLTEPGSGSDAAGMRTVAVEETDAYVLTGSKAFITNASVGGTAVVMALTDPAARGRGVSAFILERGMPGFRAGQRYRKLGLHASDTAELILEGVRV